MESLSIKRRYLRALYAADHKMVLEMLRRGANVNMNRPIGPMDVFIGKRYERGFKAILNDPDWNPNYQGVDGHFLIERAMLNRESWAIRIAAHPNFNPKQRLGQGRTLAMAAVMFSAPRMFKAFRKDTLLTDRDETGKTLEQYLEIYGYPRIGKLTAIHKSIDAYRQKMQSELEKSVVRS